MMEIKTNGNTFSASMTTDTQYRFVLSSGRLWSRMDTMPVPLLVNHL